MDLNLRSIDALTDQQVSDAKTSSQDLALCNTTQGSVLLAIFRTVSAVVAWCQMTALDVLRASRLSSSTGTDVDSWMGDFNLVRLPADSATGTVYFSRFAGSLPASVPVGTLVKTGDNTLTFVVVADPNNPRFNSVTAAYEIPADTYGVYATAQAITPGSASNVIAGAISLIASSIAFDNVTNQTAFTGGIDAESDDAFKVRFQAYIASLAKATIGAIQAAVSSTQQGLRYLVQANTDAVGAFRPGHMTITVDDGSGNPPASLITAVAANVDAVKALAETYSILPPVSVTANVSLYFEVEDGVDHDSFEVAVQTAITNYIASLTIGQNLRYSRIYSLAFGVSDSITNVGGITINGIPSNLSAGTRGLILPGIINVA